MNVCHKGQLSDTGWRSNDVCLHAEEDENPVAAPVSEGLGDAGASAEKLQSRCNDQQEGEAGRQNQQPFPHRCLGLGGFQEVSTLEEDLPSSC